MEKTIVSIINLCIVTGIVLLISAGAFLTVFKQWFNWFSFRCSLLFLLNSFQHFKLLKSSLVIHEFSIQITWLGLELNFLNWIFIIETPFSWRSLVLCYFSVFFFIYTTFEVVALKRSRVGKVIMVKLFEFFIKLWL